jgi:hypothetical protein
MGQRLARLFATRSCCLTWSLLYLVRRWCGGFWLKFSRWCRRWRSSWSRTPRCFCRCSQGARGGCSSSRRCLQGLIFNCAFVQISFCLIMYDVLATRLVRLQSAREKRLLQLPKQPTNMESLPDHLLAALRTGGLHTSATPTSRALVVPGKWRWQ